MRRAEHPRASGHVRRLSILRAGCVRCLPGEPLEERFPESFVRPHRRSHRLVIATPGVDRGNIVTRGEDSEVVYQTSGRAGRARAARRTDRSPYLQQRGAQPQGHTCPKGMCQSALRPPPRDPQQRRGSCYLRHQSWLFQRIHCTFSRARLALLESPVTHTIPPFVSGESWAAWAPRPWRSLRPTPPRVPRYPRPRTGLG